MFPQGNATQEQRDSAMSTAEVALPEAALLHFADVLVSTDELDAEMDAADLSHGPGDGMNRQRSPRARAPLRSQFISPHMDGARRATRHSWLERLWHAV